MRYLTLFLALSAALYLAFLCPGHGLLYGGAALACYLLTPRLCDAVDEVRAALCDEES